MNLKDLEESRDRLLSPSYSLNKSGVRKMPKIPKAKSYLLVALTNEFAELSDMVSWKLTAPLIILGSGERRSVVISGKYIEFDEEGNLWIEILGGKEVKKLIPDGTFELRLPREAIIFILTGLFPEAQKSFGFKPSEPK